MGKQAFSHLQRAGLQHTELGKANPTTPNAPPSSIFPPLYTLILLSYSLEYPSGLLGPAVLAHNLPCIHSLLISMAVGKAGKALALCKTCSAMTKASLHYQLYIQHISKMQLSTSSCEENQLYPSKNQHIYHRDKSELIQAFSWTSYSVTFNHFLFKIIILYVFSIA